MEAVEMEVESPKWLLDPIDRVSEVWFGLIIVLTFTCSLSVSTAGHAQVSEMLKAAFGCNLAWGILDGFMYLTGCFVRRARNIALYRVVRDSQDPGRVRAAITQALPPMLVEALPDDGFDAIHRHLRDLPEAPESPALSGKEWLKGLSVFLAVFLSTIPVALPFFFIHDLKTALRVSNGIALLMLFVTGYAFGRYAAYRKWTMGFAMMALGSILVAVTIYLGG